MADATSKQVLERLQLLTADQLQEVCERLQLVVPDNKKGNTRSLFNLVVRHLPSQEVEESSDEGSVRQLG